MMDTASATALGQDYSKSSLNSSKTTGNLDLSDGESLSFSLTDSTSSVASHSEAASFSQGAAKGGSPDWRYGSQTSLLTEHNEDLYFKYTNKDGDVLEVHAQMSEEVYSGETVKACGHHGGSDAAASIQGGADQAVASQNKDPRADVKAWAQSVKDELDKQQKKIFTQMLKHSGKLLATGDGKFLAVLPDGADPTKKSDSSDGSDGDGGDTQVPDYWNAENTSDRIVQFATQFAQISGMSPDDFAQTIQKAVGAGFDQAHAATGELPGAAGKLYNDTRNLVDTKLSKWLEDYKAKAYNQGAQAQAISTAEVPDGTENNQQLADSALYSEG